MLKRRLNKAFQHKLEFILKPTNSGHSFEMITGFDGVATEITDTYKQIFDNPTDYTEDKQHCMEDLPQIGFPTCILSRQVRFFINTRIIGGQVTVVAVQCQQQTQLGGPS